MGVFEFISGLISPVTNLVESLVTTDKDRLTLKAKLLEIQTAFSEKLLDYEAKILQAQTSIITAEANSASWLTRSWRPILMLEFGTIILFSWMAPLFGLEKPDIPTDLWDVIKIGLGGYVVGRSGEKIVQVIGAMKKKEDS